MINGHPTYEATTPLLGVQLRKTCTHVHQMTGVGTLIAALFTISPNQEKLKTSSNSGMDNIKVVQDCENPVKRCLKVLWKCKLKHYKEEISLHHTSPIMYHLLFCKQINYPYSSNIPTFIKQFPFLSLYTNTGICIQEN